MHVRRLPIGAEVQAGGGVHFRVFAPKRRTVDLVIEGLAVVPMQRDDEGYFEAFVDAARAGARYRYRLDGGEAFPDPASRFQPDGVHGTSEAIDPAAFRWTDDAWPGAALRGQVLYELHVGTFTREGTWAAAARELTRLKALGITAIEIMPIADFAGRFGWGYDGVDLFAPARVYGRPDEARGFVDAAHSIGLAVILDVVYNHFGPDGNYLSQFADEYFTARGTEWGQAINYDGPGSAAVRELVIANAGYWIDEFHFDGLRLDATQSIADSSPDHILAALTRRAREAAGRRRVFVVAENEPQHTILATPPERGGYGIDGLWNDDFHHSLAVALTGCNEAYYSDYLGAPQELISAVKYGYLFQGQYYSWQKARRGTPTAGLEPWQFVTFLENHDQVANSPASRRLRARSSPGRLRAATALVLLAPGTPMLFQGEELGSTAPFHYFADHGGELGAAVRHGRAAFLDQFPTSATREMGLPDPADAATFEACKLDSSNRDEAVWAMYRDLLALRREDAAFSADRAARVDGAVLGDYAFGLRFFADAAAADRLLVINLGQRLWLSRAPEPLLAPPLGARWEVLWSSDHPRYGGGGTPPLETDAGWILPAEAAVVLRPKAGSDEKAPLAPGPVNPGLRPG